VNTLKTTFFLTLMTVLLVGVGKLLGGNNGMVMAFIFAMIMNGISYWFSDKIVLAMYRAQRVTEAEAPELYNVTQGLASRAGMPMPKVYIIESDTPNAFATGRNPEHAAVAATTGILRLLNREELTGVLAHELSHIRHRDILISTVAATIAGAISMLANIAQWGLMFGGFGGRRDDRDAGPLGLIGMLVTIILAPLAAMLIQMAVSRSREYAADEGGAKLCGNPLSLANALRKLHAGVQRFPMRDANPATAHLFIVNPFTSGGLVNLFSTHPPIEERIARLEGMVYGR
jgi:heat shock protein HtpX